jgi:tetratricopeptide (TPR) repeat protein
MRSFLLIAVLLRGLAPAPPDPTNLNRSLDEFESRLAQDPANLRIAADYRQVVIEAGRYDRSLKLFERLSKNPRGGANRYLNLALASIDKVPVSGSIRQALLGRDAIDAATRAIAIEPTDVAFYIRGVVNLFYDRAIFHRTDKGVADLEESLRIAEASHPSLPQVGRIFVSLGDGYWRLNKVDKAREAWRAGFSRFPANEGLRARVNAGADQVPGIVERALDPGVRVDTTLRELFPDLRRVPGTTQP